MFGLLFKQIYKGTHGGSNEIYSKELLTFIERFYDLLTYVYNIKI